MPTSTSPSFRCSTCKSVSDNPKNLAVFIDGTSNKRDLMRTNVSKLFDQAIENPTQQRHYLEGIGTYEPEDFSRLERVGVVLERTIDMAIAWNAEKNVKNAYAWLVKNYREGNQIHLFGYSRGAYQVRALASMIHEVGLTNDESKVDQAYSRYRSLDPNNVKARDKAIEFKKAHCWPGVRIHFVGVWDTVSSLGLIKKDVHLTSSATLTNACHFRHALALDEHRVKFMPEYFSEVNGYHSNVQSSGEAVGDVQEIWFPGSHSDVGGTRRPQAEAFFHLADHNSFPIHAGNVSLCWMRQEAAESGLFFKPEAFSWAPVDVDLGRRNTMTFWWKCLEYLPIRHQTSFCGTGDHKWRPHLSLPRTVVPGHKIHTSALSGDVYMPRGTLGNGIDIPREARNGLYMTDPWDEEAMKFLLTSFLSDQENALRSLEKVLFILGSNNQRTLVPVPGWLEAPIIQKESFNRFALTIIYEILSGHSDSNGPVPDASELIRSTEQSFRHEIFDLLRFSARNDRLRHRFFASDNVITALIDALDHTDEKSKGISYELVVDTLCYLIKDDSARGKVVRQLDTPDRNPSKLEVVLNVKVSHHLIASLKLVVISSQYLNNQDLRRNLTTKITKLAEKNEGLVGITAVEALVALGAELGPNIPISNSMGYLNETLPQLDLEVGSAPSLNNASSPSNALDASLPNNISGSASSPPLDNAFLSDNSLSHNRTSPVNDIDKLPHVLKRSGKLDERFVRNILLALRSHDAHERTLATLTILKLCKIKETREFYSKEKVVSIFVRQLEKKETSLLAAYAFKVCLEGGMVGDESGLDCAAQSIVTMLNKGWFDDAVGRIAGSEVFRGLVDFQHLRNRLMEHKIVDTLIKMLEAGDHHQVRMGSLCLDILEAWSLADLKLYVNHGIQCLRATDKNTWEKGVKLLSALALTKGGETVIEPRVNEILKMLHAPQGKKTLPRSRILGPSAALYGLCRNESLRQRICKSPEFTTVVKMREERKLPN